jgi:hypothetical protein
VNSNTLQTTGELNIAKSNPAFKPVEINRLGTAKPQQTPQTNINLRI